MLKSIRDELGILIVCVCVSVCVLLLCALRGIFSLAYLGKYSLIMDISSMNLILTDATFLK